MNAADLPNPMDAKTVVLRRWWGRTVLAFTAATSAAIAVMLISQLVDGGSAIAATTRTFLDSPTFWFNVLYVLAIAPFVETGLMAWVIILLSQSIRSGVLVALISACIWAGLHRLVQDQSGWYAFLPFLAYSFVYIKRSREPQNDGFVVATMSHAYFNLLGLMSALAISFTR